MKLEGIHHVTCVTADAPSNADFYVRVLGLRIVKKTINQTDRTTYHIFYGDEQASYGNNISFFEYRGRPDGRAGAGNVHTIVWRVGEEGALDFWERRLAGEGVETSRSEHELDFCDHEGLAHRLSVVDTPDPPLTGESPEVPGEYALQGFDGVQAYATDAAASATFLGETLCMEPVATAAGRHADSCVVAGTRSTRRRPASAASARASSSTSPGAACPMTSRPGASAWTRCARMPRASSTATSSARPTSPSPAGCCSRSPSTAGPASRSASRTCSGWAMSCSLPPWLEERRKLYEWSLTPVPTTAALRAGLAVRS